MIVRCYFRDYDSTNNVGRIDVETENCETVYENAIVQVAEARVLQGQTNPVVLAVVK